MTASPPYVVTPGTVRTSPFLKRDGDRVVELVTGRSYVLAAPEVELLDTFAEARVDHELGDEVRRLRDRLLLLDATALVSIGALALGTLDLEAAGSCNAECVFCPRDELRHGRGVGMMRAETFARVLEVFGPYLRFVGFAGIGEPTLNKALPTWIRELRARRIDAALVTNGSFLTPVLIASLLDAGVSSVQVSFNGHDESSRTSYEIQMAGLDYTTTRANVEQLLVAARGRVPVYVSAVETTANAAELAGFVEFWRARGAEAGVVQCHSRGGTIVELRRAPRPSDQAVPRCGLFATRSFVSWDGRVLACCHDVDAETTLGDVMTDDAATIIARKLTVMRDAKWYPICRGCDEPAARMTISPDAVRAARRPAG